jgi:hypothetical protein
VVVATRNAVEPGSGRQAVPVRASLLGSIAGVTAVVAAVVFGTSLTGLITHPVRRRRRELALLKVLGMTRQQVRAIITWQTTLTLGIAIGAGRWLRARPSASDGGQAARTQGGGGTELCRRR